MQAIKYADVKFQNEIKTAYSMVLNMRKKDGGRLGYGQRSGAGVSSQCNPVLGMGGPSGGVPVR